MAKLGFYFDSDACIGCHTCAVACKDRNNLSGGVAYRKVSTYAVGTYPNARSYHLSIACNHCDAPACVEKCPTGSMHLAEDGTVQHDDSLCIGCETCVKKCPYGEPVFLEDLGITGKCDSCKPFRDAGQNPVCVDACLMRCLEFGDLDELEAKHGTELVRELSPLPSQDETGPSLRIHPKAYAVGQEAVEVIL